MWTSCVLRVSVTIVSVVLAASGVVRDSFSFEEEASSSWAFLLNSRAVMRPIVSDYSSSAIFLSVLKITLFSVFY